MGEPTERITIHTKKFYRVILESIDNATETPDSFALKLSSRVHVPLARAKLVARCLPYTAKGGLNAEQANRLKTLLEEIGGCARVEPHFVTPSESPAAARAPDRSAGAAPAVCPRCGTQAPNGSTYCSLCLRKFRDTSSRRGSLEELLPDENPLDVEGQEGGIDWLAVARFVRRRPVPVLAAIIAILVLIVLVK